MFNIKWIGIIQEEDIKKYQKGELNSNAIKMNTPNTVGQVQRKSIPFMIGAFLIIFATMFIKTYFAKSIVVNFPFIFIGVIISFVLLFIHELLHAIVYPRKVIKYIGIVKPFTPVALASYPLSKKRFICMSLLPYILGLIPLIIFIISSPDSTILNAIVFGMTFMGLSSPAPDAYNVCQIIKQVPKGKKVQFYEDDIYYI